MCRCDIRRFSHFAAADGRGSRGNRCGARIGVAPAGDAFFVDAATYNTLEMVRPVVGEESDSCGPTAAVIVEHRPLRTVDRDASAADLAAILADDGGVVVAELIDASTIRRVHSELQPHIEATRFGTDEFGGFRTRRTGSLIARSEAFRELAAHPTVLGTLDLVLGANAASYQLHLTQVIDIGPGETSQVVHRDQWAFDFFPFPTGFEVECHTMWAMTDFTEANGATRIIPGSNKWQDRLRPSLDETVAAEMSVGSVLLYVGSVYHGGGSNNTNERRMGVNVGYTLSWLRQEENQYLSCPPEIARTLPIELARLIGYQRAAYALGYFGDTQDPIEALHGRGSAAAGFAAPPQVSSNPL